MGEALEPGSQGWTAPEMQREITCRETAEKGKGQGSPGRPDSRRTLTSVHTVAVLRSQSGVALGTTALLPCTALKHVCIHSATSVMWVPSVRMRLDSGGHWNSLCSPRHTLTTTVPRWNVLTLQPCNKEPKELGARGKISCLLPPQYHLLEFFPLLPPCTLPPCCPWSPGACPCSLCSRAAPPLFTHPPLTHPSPSPCS